MLGTGRVVVADHVSVRKHSCPILYPISKFVRGRDGERRDAFCTMGPSAQAIARCKIHLSQCSHQLTAPGKGAAVAVVGRVSGLVVAFEKIPRPHCGGPKWLGFFEEV
jgi:hypothetical protein